MFGCPVLQMLHKWHRFIDIFLLIHTYTYSACANMIKTDRDY